MCCCWEVLLLLVEAHDALGAGVEALAALLDEEGPFGAGLLRLFFFLLPLLFPAATGGQ